MLFGGPHWFGRPRRLNGVDLAGFLGWFLAMSVLQTGGLGRAVAIHAVQDVVIMTLVITVAGLSAARRRSTSEVRRSSRR